MDGRVDGFLGSAAGFQWWRQECESSLWFVRTRAGVCFFLPGLMWRQPALLVGLWGEGRGRQSRTMASLARPECWAGNVRRPRPPSSSFVRFRLDGSRRCAGAPPRSRARSAAHHHVRGSLTGLHRHHWIPQRSAALAARTSFSLPCQAGDFNRPDVSMDNATEMLIKSSTTGWVRARENRTQLPRLIKMRQRS
jgi:hypothetical protein